MSGGDGTFTTVGESSVRLHAVLRPSCNDYDLSFTLNANVNLHSFAAAALVIYIDEGGAGKSAFSGDIFGNFEVPDNCSAQSVSLTFTYRIIGNQGTHDLWVLIDNWLDGSCGYSGTITVRPLTPP
jgi:hypothetical protein